MPSFASAQPFIASFVPTTLSLAGSSSQPSGTGSAIGAMGASASAAGDPAAPGLAATGVGGTPTRPYFWIA